MNAGAHTDGGLSAVPLLNAVFCADCETISNSPHDACTVCGSRSLISAGLTKGRTLTSYHTIQDDIRNSGGQWVDREVVCDRNWVSSRQPSDLPAFNREMIALFSGEKAVAH